MHRLIQKDEKPLRFRPDCRRHSEAASLLRSSGQIPRRLRRFYNRNSEKIPRLSEAKVEPKREGLPRGILFVCEALLTSRFKPSDGETMN